MDPLTADILKFFAFGIVWLFPIAIIIAVLGFSHADGKAREEDLGPNVVPFPNRTSEQPPEPPRWSDRIKRLAIPPRDR